MQRPAQFDGPEDLFPGVLRKGHLLYMTGNPGATKTLVAIDLMARLSRGKVPGKLSGKPIDVVYIGVEGGLMESIGPRFDAAYGDWDHFWCYEETLALPSDIDRLEKLIHLHSAGIVTLDPAKYHLEDRVYGSVQKTTKCLSEIEALAAVTRCTILCIDWPSKSRRKGDLSVPGNAAFTGVPRQIIAVGQLKRNEFVIGTTKINESVPFTGWIYSLDTRDIGTARNTGDPIEPALIVWERSALAAEVKRAHDQADIEEDPNLRELLQFMSPAEGAPGEPFKTEDLVNWLVNAQFIGQKKARSLISSAGSAGYLDRIDGGQADKYKVTWTITDLGKLKLAMNEESTAAAIESVFPSMAPMEFHGELTSGKKETS